MDKKGIDKLKAKRDHLTKWLDSFKRAQEIIPIVQMNLEMTDWEIKALSESPEEASEINDDRLLEKIDSDAKYIPEILPFVPSYNRDVLFQFTVGTVTGSSQVFELVSRVGDLGTENAYHYSTKFIGLYQNLQESQGRLNAVRNMIASLDNPGIKNRFERAMNAYLAAKAGVGERTAAANEIRNLLYGVRGDLINRARTFPKENMTWARMAERLSKKDRASIEYRDLIGQDATASSLIARLSDVSKDREGGSLTNLDYIWTQVLDHLYTTLGLVGFHG